MLSWLPVSARLPSGEKATEVTAAVWPASSTSFLPVAASQIDGRVVLAAGDDAPAVRREVAAEHGPLVALERLDRIWPVARSQMRAVLSPLTVSTRVRRARTSRPSTRAVWPLNTMPVGLPVATSHRRAVPSSLAVRSSRPSGENSTVLM